MSKANPIKASKGGRTVIQEVSNPDQRLRWIDLFRKNGWRVIENKGL